MIGEIQSAHSIVTISESMVKATELMTNTLVINAFLVKTQSLECSVQPVATAPHKNHPSP